MAIDTFRRHGILTRVTCPHCWERFPPEKMLWVSEHTDLLGDPRLGPEQNQRFLPTRFNVTGQAIDAKGFPCYTLACPHCHLAVPRGMLENEPLFLSILGAPASGKSFYLSAMTWELRKSLSFQFAVSFTDADPLMNRSLNAYEEALFVNDQGDYVVPLSDLIQKTDEQGDHYDFVTFGTQSVSYPRPILFSANPEPRHPYFEDADDIGRTICLYDNAGEHFQPGRDTVSSPVTRHLAQSRALFFIFDPTQDSRVRQHCRVGDAAPNSSREAKVGRQEPILQEAAARVRRYTGLRQNEKHKKPLICVVTKYDLWSQMLDQKVPSDPWRSYSPKGEDSDDKLFALDVQKVDDMSRSVRGMLLQYCPEMVAAAESFAADVTYVPVSAVGWGAHPDPTTGQLCIRPSEAAPYWVTVPFLYALYKGAPRLIPVLRREKVAKS